MNTSYYYQKQYDMRFYVEGGLERLINRLKRGMILKSRIVYCMGANRYLLRIYGYNMVMESPLKFNRFDEIHIRVVRVHPRLELRFLSSRKKKDGSSRHTKMNILI